MNAPTEAVLGYEVAETPPILAWFKEGRIQSRLLEVARTTPVLVGGSERLLLVEKQEAGLDKAVDLAGGPFQPTQLFVNKILEAGFSSVRFTWKLDGGELIVQASSSLEEMRDVCAAFACIGLLPSVRFEDQIPEDFREGQLFTGPEAALFASARGAAAFVRSTPVHSARNGRFEQPHALDELGKGARPLSLTLRYQPHLEGGRIVTEWAYRS